MRFFLFLFAFFASLDGAQTNICLTFTTHNEAATIVSFLDQATKIVDCVSICDLGSTDGTAEVIERYLRVHGLPGKVHLNAKETQLVPLAQKTLEELHFSHESTYLFFAETQLQCSFHLPLDKQLLTKDAYLLPEKTPDFCSYKLRLARASLGWENTTCAGWTCNWPFSASRLDAIELRLSDDRKAQSVHWKLALKKSAHQLEQTPQNPTAFFWSGVVHYQLKHFEESITWHAKHLEKGKNPEFVWLSTYTIGRCHEELGNMQEALKWYLQAYNAHPERAEPLFKLASYYAKTNQYHLAYLCAKQGLLTPFPTTDQLFIESALYPHGFKSILASIVHLTRYKKEGLELANDLALSRQIPEATKKKAQESLLHYIENLPHDRLEPIQISPPLIREGSDARFLPMNATIQKTKEGYDIICRTVNYAQTFGFLSPLDPLDPTKTILSRNYLLKYSKDFQFLSQQELVERLPLKRCATWTIQGWPIAGLQDCRLAQLGDEKWVACTVCDMSPYCVPQVALCKLGAQNAPAELEIERFALLKGPDPQRIEKNWLPFVKNNELFTIYSYDPFTIYKPDLQTGQCETVLRYQAEQDLSNFKGSAPPIEFEGGYLVLIHEMIETSQRNYIHRFIYLDADFRIKTISKPFTFCNLGVEYCCGMALDESGKQLVLTISLEDRSAYLCFIDVSKIHKLLDLP